MDLLYGIKEKSDCDSRWKIIVDYLTRKKYRTNGNGFKKIEKEISTIRLEFDSDQIFFYLERFESVLSALYRDPAYRTEDLDYELAAEKNLVSYLYGQSIMNVMKIHEIALGRMEKLKKTKEQAEKVKRQSAKKIARRTSRK